MQWSDVTRAPSPKMLRQFAALFLIVFLGLAGWRWHGGRTDVWTQGMAIVAVVVGAAGLAVPALVRPIYTGWMIAAFPIGWTVSRLALALTFFGVVTPMGWIFRITGRDALMLRRRAVPSYWSPKTKVADGREYFRQT